MRLTGWADTQSIFRAFINPIADKDGTDAQAKYIGYKPYPFRTEGKNCEFDSDHLEDDAKLHIVQDLRLPFAILLQASIDRAEFLNMDLEENILPNLNFTIKICNLTGPCSMGFYVAQDIFVRERVIAGTLETYDPKKIRFFVWKIQE
jgi:hypothetical protein